MHLSLTVLKHIYVVLVKDRTLTERYVKLNISKHIEVMCYSL